MAFSVGIDLGTTNTVVSIASRGINSNIEVLTESINQLNQNGFPEESSLLPSVLYVDNGEHMVGAYAYAMKGQNLKRVIFNSKNYMGESSYKWDIDGKEYSPELVASFFLSAIRNHLKDKYNGNESIESAVITVPASFNIDQRNATKNAAVLSGFKGEIILISEPTAAILDFINEQSKILNEDKILELSDFKKVLVFDLGGGTCDVAILNIKINGNEIYVAELAVSPHTLVGGANFDAYAVEGIISDYEKENCLDLSKELKPTELKALKSKLFTTMEKVKMYFSGNYFKFDNGIRTKDEIISKISLPITIPNIINGNPFTYNLTMAKYNKYISPLLNVESDENIIKPIISTINSNSLTIDDIDYTFCVGGMTKYPMVWDTIKSFFGKAPLKLADAMQSVSRGAAIYHHYNIINVDNREKKNSEKVVDIIPTLPQTIFLNVKDGFPIPLIEAKTKAGTPIIIEDLIETNSNVIVSLELYAGMSPYDPNLKRLENVNINFPHGIEIGSKISLKLEYTKKGILVFEAWVKDNEDIKINLSLEGNQFTDEEIEDINNEYEINKVGGIL
ncbi:molecular chaperone DnaK [Clostridium putrefaciens]|uniref:Molecular chaperone DnaK n=1 Tax=Clostridium putrefaciens TaxID=99675 RepID=A0A381J4I1_9CLOT|nr:Hsp70 family protein [Clostridium putrefaciens]SUY45773.1 molecular chaperone DnaK [Clostridium putrefaciens]